MYDPIVDIIKIVVGIAIFAITIILLKKTKSKVLVGQVSQDPLTGQEKLLIWILCIFNPVLAGAILYYGWRKVLPEKAKMANQISFAALGLAFVLLILFSLLFSNEKSDENVPVTVNSPTLTAELMIDSKLNSDSDTIPDTVEIVIGTNPNKTDTDDDSFDDLSEIKSGYSPFIAGITGMLTVEESQAMKDKIKAVDQGFYEKNFEISPVSSQSPIPIVSFICGTSTVKDIDNNIYNTVKIGDHCWLKENLKVTKNSAGEIITRYCYDNDPKICETDGGLYDWNTAMNKSIIEGAQGICPNGWHVPKDSEWFTLENYLKDSGQTCDSARSVKWDCDTAGKKLKSEGSSGFDGLLAGQRNNNGLFLLRGMIADLWSSTQSDFGVWGRALFFGNKSTIGRITSDKAYGFSVRCLKD